MAADFGPLGIRVNAIAPGEIDTAILSPGTEEIVAHQIPLHRLGTPDEVAKIIYVLCTETVVVREWRRNPHQRRPARLSPLPSMLWNQVQKSPQPRGEPPQWPQGHPA